MSSDPMQYIGLFLDARRQKDQAQAQQQSMVMQQKIAEQAQLDDAFQTALQVAATGDVKGSLGILAVKAHNRESQAHRDAVEARAKFAKDQEKAQQYGPKLQENIAQTLAPLMAARGQGQFASPEQQARFGKSIASASQALGNNPDLGAIIASGTAGGMGVASKQEREFGDFGARQRVQEQSAIRQSDVIASRQNETWYDPQTAAWTVVNATDRKGKKRLIDKGFKPVPFSITSDSAEKIFGEPGKKELAEEGKRSRDLSESLVFTSSLLKYMQTRSKTANITGAAAIAARTASGILAQINPELGEAAAKRMNTIGPQESGKFVSNAQKLIANSMKVYIDNSGRYTDYENKRVQSIIGLNSAMTSVPEAVGALESLVGLYWVNRDASLIRSKQDVPSLEGKELMQQMRQSGLSNRAIGEVLADLEAQREFLSTAGAPVQIRGDRPTAGPAAE